MFHSCFQFHGFGGEILLSRFIDAARVSATTWASGPFVKNSAAASPEELRLWYARQRIAFPLLCVVITVAQARRGKDGIGRLFDVPLRSINSPTPRVSNGFGRNVCLGHFTVRISIRD